MGKLWKEFRVKVILTILVVSRKCEEVFGGVSSRDVNMSAPSRL